MLDKKMILAAGFTMAFPAFAEDASAIKIDLQASMQRHIDRTLIDGQLLAVDYEEGSVDRFYPTKVHTAVLKGEGYYVLCSEVTNAAGESVDVDYYLAKGKRGFKVFRTVINNRAPLMSLMETGSISRF